LNVLAMGVGGQLGGILGDRLHETPTFVIAIVVSLVPLVIAPKWDSAAKASAREPA
jgi:hypothetical protein